MPPSFSRFRQTPTKRPRKLQPKTFIPPYGEGLPRPIDITPDFEMDNDIVTIGLDTNIIHHTPPSAVTIPQTTASTNVDDVLGSREVLMPLQRAVPIAPKPVRKRATGVLPLASRAPWLLYEDRLLTVLVKRYGDEWELISSHFSDRSAVQVQRRWNDHLKVGVQFSKEELAIIRKMLKKAPESWDRIAEVLHGRTAASIRYYWFYCVQRSAEYGFR